MWTIRFESIFTLVQDPENTAEYRPRRHIWHDLDSRRAGPLERKRAPRCCLLVLSSAAVRAGISPLVEGGGIGSIEVCCTSGMYHNDFHESTNTLPTVH